MQACDQQPTENKVSGAVANTCEQTPKSTTMSAGLLIKVLKSNREKRDWQSTLILLNDYGSSKMHNAFDLYIILDEWYVACFYTAKYDKCLEILKSFNYSYVDNHIICNSDYLLPHLRKNKRVVATFNPKRRPIDDSEIIICYGDYPIMYEGMLIHNPCYRPVSKFWAITHDDVEYDHIWDPVDRIYIINLDERVDRYVETLRELKRMGAPLHRTERLSAIRYTSTVVSKVDGNIGCAMSHLKVVKKARDKKYANILVLEDDFQFTEDLQRNRESIIQFFARGYDYDVCLLATRIDGRIEEYDDILSHTRQPCTHRGGYFISKEGMRKVIPIWEDGLKLQIKYKEPRYAGDRVWTAMFADNKFFVFRWKVGYQRVGYSDITKEMRYFAE